MDQILLATYKRTRDGHYIFNNLPNIAYKLGWRSIEGFILYMDEEANINVEQRCNKYYIDDNTNIRIMNDFFIKEYNKQLTTFSGII